MRLIENTIKLLAPYNCLVCGSEGRIVCGSCVVDSFPAIPSRCYRCKKLTNEFAVCNSCRRHTRLKNVWVCCEYRGVAKDVIQTMKYKSNREACQVVAGVMAELLPILPTKTVAINIPTATTRKRQRGFDHTKLIARDLAKLLELQYENSLGRLDQTRQVGSDRKTRTDQLKEAFIVRTDVSGKVILLVDDMTTTGATLENAAEVLKDAGAKKVYAITFAQK